MEPIRAEHVMRLASLRLLSLTVILLPAGCGRGPSEMSENAVPEKLAVSHLPNAYRIHPKVISGGQPEGDEAFAELRSLGVKTIISVDGVKPDVGLAHKFGMRYVHLPHGYDGIPDDRVKELAKAVRDLEGPIYVHCHHGKHRSPTAAAVGCVGAGLLKPGAALSVLQTAGTSENYRGLYQSAEQATRLEDALLDRLRVEYREVAELPPLAEAMVAVEHTFDRLKLTAKAGWRPPKDHPDVEPAHEALILREHFTELLRKPDVKQKPERFQELLRESESAGKALEAGLREWKTAGGNSPLPAAVGNAFDRITKDCTACHTEFRDVPLAEKKR